MRIAIAGGIAALALASTALADIGPIDPARKICMGLQDGDACMLDGKAGTCHGPHPSRMSCDPRRPPSQGSASAAADPATGSAAANPERGSAAAGSAQTSNPGTAEPSPTPGHKRGCSVTEPGSAALIGLAIAALALRRGRRSRSMS